MFKLTFVCLHMSGGGEVAASPFGFLDVSVGRLLLFVYSLIATNN